MDLARPRLQQLADDLAMAALLAMPSGYVLVIADLIHPVGHRSRTYQLRAGDRIVFRPPHAAALVVWSAPAIIDRWIRRGDPDTSPQPTPNRSTKLWPRTPVPVATAVQEHRSPHDVRDRSPLPSAGGSRRARSIDVRIDDWMRDKQLVNDVHEREEVWPISVSAADLRRRRPRHRAGLDARSPPHRRHPRPSSASAARSSNASTDVTETIHGRIPQP